jgi:hypothetical protein
MAGQNSLSAAVWVLYGFRLSRNIRYLDLSFAFLAAAKFVNAVARPARPPFPFSIRNSHKFSDITFCRVA